MREKLIEQKLVKTVKDRGGICPKLVCPAFDGIPHDYQAFAIKHILTHDQAALLLDMGLG